MHYFKECSFKDRVLNARWSTTQNLRTYRTLLKGGSDK
jgi:hypothetical protein